MIVLAAVVPLVGLALLVLLGRFEARFLVMETTGGPLEDSVERPVVDEVPRMFRLRLECSPDLDARLLARAAVRLRDISQAPVPPILPVEPRPQPTIG